LLPALPAITLRQFAVLARSCPPSALILMRSVPYLVVAEFPVTVRNLQAVGQLAPSFPRSKSDRSITGRNPATRKSSGALCAVQSLDLVQRLARDAVRAQGQHLSLTRCPLGLIDMSVRMILSAAISRSCTSLRTSSPPSMGCPSSVLS